MQSDLRQAVGQDVAQVKGVAEERLSDVFDAIGTQNIESDGAQAGKIQRVDADPAGVFAKGYVADVMMGFNLPMASNGGGEISGTPAIECRTRAITSSTLCPGN